jgi:hypothetical protein
MRQGSVKNTNCVKNPVVLNEITGDRKVRTSEELEAVMKEPMGPALRGMSGCTRAWWTKPAGCGRR